MAYTRKKEKATFILGGVFVGIIITSVIASIYLILNNKDINNVINSSSSKEESTKKDMCLIAKEEIKKGSQIKDEQFVAKSVDFHLIPEDRLEFSSGITDKVSAIDIKTTTILTDSMFVSKDTYTNDTRYQDYSEIRLPIDLVKGDTVDVRIKRKTGDDYIILSKKEITERANNTIWIMIDEIERMRMNKALLEFRDEMAELYTTKYVNSIDQYAPSVTYLK